MSDNSRVDHTALQIGRDSPVEFNDDRERGEREEFGRSIKTPWNDVVCGFVLLHHELQPLKKNTYDRYDITTNDNDDER